MMSSDCRRTLIKMKSKYSGMPKSERPKSELYRNPNFWWFGFQQVPNFVSSGFNEHGAQTEHLVSTIKT